MLHDKLCSGSYMVSVGGLLLRLFALCHGATCMQHFILHLFHGLRSKAYFNSSWMDACAVEIHTGLFSEPEHQPELP
jgi:hypothetical protein